MAINSYRTNYLKRIVRHLLKIVLVPKAKFFRESSHRLECMLETGTNNNMIYRSEQRYVSVEGISLLPVHAANWNDDSSSWIERLSSSSFILNSKGTIISWSPLLETLTGISPDSVIGSPCSDLKIFYDSRQNGICSNHCPVQRAVQEANSQLGRCHVWIKRGEHLIPVVKTVIIIPIPNQGEWIALVTLDRDTDPLDKFDLTPTEKRVLQFICQGYSTTEIGMHMNIAYTTVRTHIHRLLCKLHVRSQKEAVAKVWGTYKK